MDKYIKITGVIICLFLSLNSIAQDRIKKIETQLKSMTTDVPGLEENVEMSVSGVSIQEFMRGIADAHKLNIMIGNAGNSWHQVNDEIDLKKKFNDNLKDNYPYAYELLNKQ